MFVTDKHLRSSLIFGGKDLGCPNVAPLVSAFKASPINFRLGCKCLNIFFKYFNIGSICNQSIVDVSSSNPIGLYQPLDDITNSKYKLLCFLTTNKKNPIERQ